MILDSIFFLKECFIQPLDGRGIYVSVTHEIAEIISEVFEGKYDIDCKFSNSSHDSICTMTKEKVHSLLETL